MDRETVLIERQGRIAYVILNRPERLNAISHQLQVDLRSAWDEVRDDRSIRVAILRGSGRGFCAGADISGSRSERPTNLVEDAQRILFSIQTCMMAWDLPKPVIAQIHGACMGVGNMMASFTDIRIVADDARISPTPKVPIGGGMISPLWMYYAGAHRAKELSMSVSSEYTGKQAAAWNWANYSVPPGELEEFTFNMAKEIAKLSSDLLALKKQAVNHHMDAIGFRTAAILGAELDALAHDTDTSRFANRKLRELGIRGALEWWANEDGIPDDVEK